MVLLFPLRVRQNGPQTAGTGRQPRYFASRRSRNLQAGMMPPSVCCGRNERKEPPGTIAGRFLKIRPAFLPHHTGTKADALRGTTLIRRSPECRRLIALIVIRHVDQTEPITTESASRARLRGEFGGQPAGSHHPPALSTVTAAYYSSSAPLFSCVQHRRLRLRRLLSRRFHQRGHGTRDRT